VGFKPTSSRRAKRQAKEEMFFFEKKNQKTFVCLNLLKPTQDHVR